MVELARGKVVMSCGTLGGGVMYCHVTVTIPMGFNALNKVNAKKKQNLDSRAVLLKVVITLTAF